MNQSTVDKVYLVEIRLKDWRPDLPYDGRTVTYEEVLARDEVSARHTGFHQFEKRCKHEPVLRRRMTSLGIDHVDCCAPDAVQLDD